MENFESISLKFFNNVKITPCDLYVKLSENKHIKVLKQKDVLTSDFIRKYINRKVENFFLTEADFKLHSQTIFSFTGGMEEMLDGLPKINHETINLFANELGIQNKHIQKTSLIVKEIIHSATVSKDLSGILKRGLFSKERFMYDHSYLTAIICNRLADKNDWTNTQGAKESLTLAAFYHDCELKSEKVYQVEVLGEASAFEKNHAQDAANKLGYSEEFSSESLKIIKNHHNVDGGNLGPLEHAFITCHEFVIELYRHKFDLSQVDDILQTMLEKFDSTGIRKQISKLQGIF